MRKRILTFVFLFSLCFAFCQMTSEKWNADIKYLQNNLTDKHYNLFFKRERRVFDQDIVNLISKTNQLSDLETALRLQQIVAKQGDSHTNISWTKYLDENKFLPFGCYYFNDGIYVTYTSYENKELLGTKVLTINGFDVKKITDSLATLTVNENNAIYKNQTPGFLVAIQLLKYFGFAKSDDIKIKFQGKNSVFEKVLSPKKIESKDRVKINPGNLTFIRENKKKYFEKKYFEKEKILYVLYNSCVSKEEPSIYKGKSEEKDLPSFVDFQNEILKILENENVDKLFFDMRLNQGGSISQGNKLIKKIAENSKINKKGKLYVGIGRNTFSAAIINARYFEENTKAILIGEETMGKPNHYGILKYMNLPNSGIELSYSSDLLLTSKKKNQNTMEPDFLIDESFEDYEKGVDPVFEFVKRNH